MKEIKDTLVHIYNKLETIDEKQASIAEVQVRHEENLREHMRRTELLEQEFHPVRRHVEQLRGAGKLTAFTLPLLIAIASWYFLK